jgi:pimeloyl-ACP methyl ester carboxylesterase
LIPVHFGSSDRKLLGLYTPARAATSSERAVVLCHPWGQEYLRAHRSMRQLATMLAGKGYHAFRFDYYGTGDSFGESTDGDLDGWIADIQSAIQELQDTAGVVRVALLGLRLGGALAARVAAQHPDLIDRLVLWDPVVTGPEYLHELVQMPSPLEMERGRVLPHRADNAGEWEVRGFPLSVQLANAIETIDLVELVASLPEKTLILTSQRQSSHARVQAALAAHNHPAIMEEIDAAPAWLEERNLGAGAIPVKLLHRIVDWLT